VATVHYLFATLQHVPEAGGRICADVRDAGTTAMVTKDKAPGMDELYYREHRWEEDAFADDRAKQNADMVSCAESLELAPWPDPLPKAAPVDLTPRYDQGLKLRLHQATGLLPETDDGRWGEVPDGLAQILDPATHPPDPFNREASHVVADLTPEEVQAAALDPTEWLRLPFRNETGGCDYKRPIRLRWDGLQGSQFALVLENGLLFAPWDLREGAKYHWQDDAGKAVEHGEIYSELRAGADPVLYIRPRRWRWWIHVWAHYEFVQTWWEQEVMEEFTRIFFDRPPFYPMRHDVLHTASQAWFWHEYENAFLAYDAGVDSKVILSRAASDLRHEIVMAQWFDLCTAYILMDVEIAKVTIWADTPRVGDAVLGVGLRSSVLDVEKRVWAVQLEDVTARYPRTLIGQFYSDFF
jgi:hypothetical protein